MSALSQITSISAMNLRGVPQRLGSSFVIVIANDVFASPGSVRMAYAVALTVHIPFVLLETFALLWKAPFLTRHAAH